MREIKFRTPWFSKDGIFHGFTYWGYLGKQGGFVLPYQRAGLIKKGDEQYTGRKDNGGKEIYDGDILCAEVATYTGVDVEIHAVMWDGNQGAWVCGGNFAENFPYFEVIGNIHETPELLEKHK